MSADAVRPPDPATYTNRHGPLTDDEGRPLALAAGDKSAAAAAARGKSGKGQPTKPKRAISRVST